MLIQELKIAKERIESGLELIESARGALAQPQAQRRLHCAISTVPSPPRPVFAAAWNWVDAYLRVVYAGNLEFYQLLRQGMLARRAIILLDGLDEGGRVREQVERHVTQVLAPQGHVMLVSSRPNGVQENLFDECFHRIELCPLTDEQQKQVILHRRACDHHYFDGNHH